MGLREILLAITASFPCFSYAQEQPCLQKGEQMQEQENSRQEIEEYARKETGALAIKRGYSWGNEKRYEMTSAGLMTDGYLAEFRLRNQNSKVPEKDDTISVGSFELNGFRRQKFFQADFAFGMQFYQRARKWYDVSLYGQVVGGFQVVKNIFTPYGSADNLPGDPDIDFFGGGGARSEAVFRVPRIGSYYFSAGLGWMADYLYTAEDDFMARPVQGFQYSAYGLIRFSREKERKELRLIKRE